MEDGRAEAMEAFILIMRESGAWRDVDPDEYVRSLRAAWGEGDARSGPPATPVRAGPDVPLHLVGVPLGIPEDDPLLQLRKIAMESGIWKDIDPAEYVRELRADWD